MTPEREEDMSSFAKGQLAQLGNKLQEASWSAEDVTNLGQASIERLTEIRLSLNKSDVIVAIEDGQTELWLAPGQDTGWVQGRKILKHLTDTGLLASCVDLDELRAVQAKGIDFFRKYFAAKIPFGWRGVQDGFVPYLFGDGGEVVLYWFHLGRSWSADYPALRRK
ncbi:MAG: hypothetical protein AAB687_01960 [Patescibacteria group bacterium]